MSPFGYLFTLHEQRFLSGMAFSICAVIRVTTNCTLLTRQTNDFANAESHTRKKKKTSARRLVSFAADTEGET